MVAIRVAVVTSPHRDHASVHGPERLVFSVVMIRDARFGWPYRSRSTTSSGVAWGVHVIGVCSLSMAEATLDYFERSGRAPDVVFVNRDLVDQLGGYDELSGQDPLIAYLVANYQVVDAEASVTHSLPSELSHLSARLFPESLRHHGRAAKFRAPGSADRVRDSAAMEATEIRKLATLEDTHWWYAERRAVLAREIDGITPGVAVDIGAAGGGNTRVLRAHGWRATALEYSPDGAEVARDRGIPVIRADGCALPLASGSLDMVVAFDVLEHISDDKTAASEIARVLRPGGIALVAVPADPRLWSAHDEAVGHVRRYTRETLTATLASAGLTLEHMRSWNVLLRPIAAWRRKRSTGSDLDRLPAAVNLGLRAVVAAERYLPVDRLSGVSLIARVRRP